MGHSDEGIVMWYVILVVCSVYACFVCAVYGKASSAPACVRATSGMAEESDMKTAMIETTTIIVSNAFHFPLLPSQKSLGQFAKLHGACNLYGCETGMVVNWWQVLRPCEVSHKLKMSSIVNSVQWNTSKQKNSLSYRCCVCVHARVCNVCGVYVDLCA